MTEDNSTDSKKSTPDIKPVRSEAMVSKSNRPIGGASMLFTATLGFINLGGLVLLFFWFFSTSDNQQQAGQNFIERISLLEEGLVTKEAQIDELAQNLDSDLKFVNKEVRKLWDLSNKRNKVNIQKLTEQTEKIDKLLTGLQKSITNNQDSIYLLKENIDLNISKLESLQLSTRELNVLKASINNLDTQLILLDDSVQALNNYKNQLNQVIFEIQTDISSIQLPSNQNTSNQN